MIVSETKPCPSYQFIKAALIVSSVPEEHYHNPLIPPLPRVPIMRRWAQGLGEWGQPSRRHHAAAWGLKNRQLNVRITLTTRPSENSGQVRLQNEHQRAWDLHPLGAWQWRGEGKPNQLSLMTQDRRFSSISQGTAEFVAPGF